MWEERVHLCGHVMFRKNIHTTRERERAATLANCVERSRKSSHCALNRWAITDQHFVAFRPIPNHGSGLYPPSLVNFA